MVRALLRFQESVPQEDCVRAWVESWPARYSALGKFSPDIVKYKLSIQ